MARHARSLVQSWRAVMNRPIHPWWQYLPPEQKKLHQRCGLRGRRLLAWLKRQPQRIGLAVTVYLLICAVPLMFGLTLISVVALLPLLLVPPVGFLVYWLVWKEFHH